MVADIPQNRDQFGILGHGVKSVPVDDEVATVGGLVEIAVNDFEAAEAQGEKAVEDVIVVAAEVNDLGFLFFNFFEDETDKARVPFVPTAAAIERPSINDVAIEDEVLAGGVFEEMVDLLDLTVRGAEVDVGEEDGLEVKDRFWGHGQFRARVLISFK